jgi:Tol biopolymer transport system component
MLPSGTRLGPYEVLGLIGEGGMGQVYRAADTRLDRAVAIKVMPAALDDPIRRERFEREARSISKLEHPNICPLYDIGELPDSVGGGLFLVMQFLEGETLAQRLARGPLSIKDTLDVAIQIAEALSVAHRAGIVHRDLKPGNVMLTRAGARLLDFGLARTVATGVAGGDTAAGDRTSLTTQGTLLGTLHYMAPEQLDGRVVDTRADIFAFGAMVYEMVTGLKAFEAETPARVMSAILRDEPTRVATLVPITPVGLDELIHTCLAKDPNERWQGMGDVARQLRWLQSSLSAKSGSMARPAAAAPPAARWRWSRSWPIAVAVFIGLAAGAALMRGLSRTAPAEVVRLHALVLPPENNYLTGGVALSPDGATLAFVATDANGERQLWIRQLDTSRAQPIEGTAGASDPFFSPSGGEIAFFANEQLKRISIGGGAAAVICEAGAGAGGTWNRDGVIVFQPHQQGHLMRVAAAGGLPEPAVTLDAAAEETHHLYPSFLPDGRHFVFYVAGKRRGLYVGELGSNDRSFLFDPDPSLPPGAAATPGVYADSGHLLYVRDRVLMARPFNAGSRSVSGEAFKLADTVDYNPPGQAAFAIARDVLVYRPRQHLALGSLVWIDRSGESSAEVPASAAAFRQVSLAPDGRTAAVERRDAQGVSSVWTIDLEAGATVRVPAEYWSGYPVWSRDGSMLAYSIAADSPPNIVVRGNQGGGAERRLTKSAVIQYPAGFTPDARTLLYRAFSSDTGWDLFTVAVDGSSPPQRLLQTPANENEMSLSPDGRFLAYTSDESGRTEVYVSRFPEMSGRVPASAGGGQRPLWRADGRELFFVGPGNRLMAAGVTITGPTPSVARASSLFEVPLFGGLYAPSADGRRFLIAMPAPSTDVVPMELRINPLVPR